MKNNEEFRNSVFEKAEAYAHKRKERRAKNIRTAVAVAMTLAVFIPIIYLPISIGIGNNSTAGMGSMTTEAFVSGQTCGTTMAGASTEAMISTTNSTTVTTTTVTTQAFTQVTSAATTKTTTTPSFIWATTSATVIVPIPPQSGGHYYNGAFSYKTEYDGNLGSDYDVTVVKKQCDDTRAYFSDRFFEKNSVIMIRFNADSDMQAPTLVYYSVDKLGTLIIDIDTSEQQEHSGNRSAWVMLIPITKNDMSTVEEIELRD